MRVCYAEQQIIQNRTMERSARSAAGIRRRRANESALADRLYSALCTATNGHIVAARTEQQDLPHEVDLEFTLHVGGESADIAVEVLRNAYPRDIREAVWRLDGYLRASRRPNVITMIAADSLSPGARETLRDRGIGYFERNGNLHLRWQQWLIDIQRPELPSTKKDAVALFTESREMVVHALLVHRREWLTGGELAQMAKTSSYTCSVVLQELERREWCESSGAGRTLRRRLNKPRELLDAWAEHWTMRKKEPTRWYVFSPRPELLLEQLSQQIGMSNDHFEWAFTGTAAANIYAPLLTNVDSAEIIVEPGRTELLAQTLKLKPAEKGANVILVEREGASLLFRNQQTNYSSYFASPFILYLDLLDGRGRNKALAQHVLEKLEL